MTTNAHPDQPETLEEAINRILSGALLSASCLTPFDDDPSIQNNARAELLEAVTRHTVPSPPAPSAWSHDMTAAPKNGPDFLAKNAKGDVRRCWRAAPSSRTDEIRTFNQQKFAAVAWMPLDAVEQATPAQPYTVSAEGEHDRFWLILKEPGRVPELKGPWLNGKGVMTKTLREFIAARPTAYIDVLSWGASGPLVQHGPEALQVLDGRSMGVGRKHNARTAEAHSAYHAPPAPSPVSRALEAVSKLAQGKLSAYPDFGAADPAILHTINLTGEQLEALAALPAQKAEA
ncbi:hypothetical protein V7S57_02560 [Caulobacter sp. CCNWLY153]|uniref:hypothetical protein n=1 Tax=unclassified Caulobacter TaxID=2648921 RepID=UPI002FF1B726